MKTISISIILLVLVSVFAAPVYSVKLVEEEETRLKDGKPLTVTRETESTIKNTESVPDNNASEVKATDNEKVQTQAPAAAPAPKAADDNSGTFSGSILVAALIIIGAIVCFVIAMASGNALFGIGGGGLAIYGLIYSEYWTRIWIWVLLIIGGLLITRSIINANIRCEEEEKVREEKEKEEKERLQQEAERLRWQKAQRDKQRLSALVNKYGADEGRKIFDGNVWTGMTIEQMNDSLGKSDAFKDGFRHQTHFYYPVLGPRGGIQYKLAVKVKNGVVIGIRK